MTIVKTLIISFFSIISITINAQNRLEPVNESIFDSNNERFKYHSEIRKTLFEDINPEYFPLARYIVTPSFKPEYALTLIEATKNII